MSKFPPSFPDYIELNGADNFLLQLDRIMYQSSVKRNVCTLVLTFEEQLDIETLENLLSDNSAFKWISSLRLRTGMPFFLAKWVVKADAERPKINQYQPVENNNIPVNFLGSDINPESQAPFKIDLLTFVNSGSVLIFTWHHSLMDAHGGESFVHYLGSSQTKKNPQWLQQFKTDLPLRQRSQIALEMKDFLHDVSKLPLLSLYSEVPNKPNLNYQVQTFTEQQSQQINQRAGEYGASFLMSAFYLASSICSIVSIQQQRGSKEGEDGDILIPIPIDRRRKGTNEPIIGNQVSFLFYRVPKHASSDLQACTTELIEQMKNLMRSNSPERCLLMMDFMRRIPGPIYRLMLKQPTKGLMASFFFSDIGESLLDQGALFEQSIANAVHYPPTTYPPGMTFVFSRFRGRLRITLGYMQNVINEQEVESLFSHMRLALLGDESS